MVAAPFTATHDTPNKSPRQDVKRLGVVLHHAATTSLTTLRNLAMGGKQVSATAIVKDNIAELLVADAFRPWSLSSAYWDSALRSIECANESTTGWTISDRSHETMARCVAYWADTDGFWPHRDGDPKTWTVIGHGEVHTIHGASYATACPGGMDMGRVTLRAQELLTVQPAAETVTPLLHRPGQEHTVNALTYKAPNGTIIRVSNGFKQNYKTADDYNAHRRILQFTKDYYTGKSVDTSDIDVPPLLSDVMGVSWADYEVLKRVYGFTD